MSTELYKEDLDSLMTILDSLEDISGVDGVFAAEIRVKFDDCPTWVVIGWGESGNPCVLRFESDPTPVVINKQFTTTINPAQSQIVLNPTVDYFNSMQHGAQ